MTKLEKVRTDKGYSVYDLHKKSGVNITTITNIEKGKTKSFKSHFHTLYKLAKTLGVTVEEIVDIEE